jgi:hypothetical protein
MSKNRPALALRLAVVISSSDIEIALAGARRATGRGPFPHGFRQLADEDHVPQARLDYRPDGVSCEVDLPLDR